MWSVSGGAVRNRNYVFESSRLLVSKMSEQKFETVSVTEWYEQETIRRAIAGDQASGLEALRLASAGLRIGRLSFELAQYLADRLDCVREALQEASDPAQVKPGSAHAKRQTLLTQALLINRPAVKPKNPFPDWEQPLAALGVYLLRQGVQSEKVKVAMINARERREGKDLDRSDAGKILKKYAPLRKQDDEFLMDLMGDLRDLVLDFLPQT